MFEYIHVGKKKTIKNVNPHNVLINKAAGTDNEAIDVLMTDVGLEDLINANSFSTVATSFKAPELKNKNDTLKVVGAADIWSLGALILFLVTGETSLVIDSTKDAISVDLADFL